MGPTGLALSVSHIACPDHHSPITFPEPLQLSASISLWGVEFLSVGTRVRESSGQTSWSRRYSHRCVNGQPKCQRMLGQAKLKETKFRKAGGARKERKGPTVTFRGALGARAKHQRKDGLVTDQEELLLTQIKN